MTAKETLAEREKRKLDLQLDAELEGTFPASDPLKITRFCAKRRGAPKQQHPNVIATKNEP